VNQPTGLDTRANWTEWARRVSPRQKTAEAEMVQEKKIYGDSTKPGVCERLDALPKGRASHKSLPTE
jgi:hypothetical protein